MGGEGGVPLRYNIIWVVLDNPFILFFWKLEISLLIPINLQSFAAE